MGVQGLWGILEPVARPTRLDALSDKKLAVDASIWIHHFIKSLRDSKTQETLPNAHILGFFRRICKLLFFNIKPVFVFDGSVPELKKREMSRRKQRIAEGLKESEGFHNKIITAKLKKHALETVRELEETGAIQKRGSKGADNDPSVAHVEKDMFELPAVTVADEPDYESEEDYESEYDNGLWQDGELDIDSIYDPYSMTLDAEKFRALPEDVQGSVLYDLRKKSRHVSRERMKMLDKTASDVLDFSKMQIRNLVKRNNLWNRLENVTNDEKESRADVIRKRVVGQVNTEYMLIKSNDGATWKMVPKVEKVELKEDERYTLDEVPRARPVTSKAEDLSASDDETNEDESKEFRDLKRNSKNFTLKRLNLELLSIQRKIEKLSKDVAEHELFRMMTYLEELIAEKKYAEPDEKETSSDSPAIIEKQSKVVSDTSEEESEDEFEEVPLQRNIIEDPSLQVETKSGQEVEKTIPEVSQDYEEEVVVEEPVVDLVVEPEEEQYFEDEDRELVETSEKKQDMEDGAYADFMAQLVNKNMAEVEQDLQNEIDQLRQQFHDVKRHISTITSDMVDDIQELLRLFGIPYVVAPFEAESQCAQMYMNKQIDGIVTEDSDVFLFGGGNIYKNMFNQSKFVEFYTDKDIYEKLYLSRERLIQVAMMLGSDYTEGIKGVGPVSALEILTEFPGETTEGLKEFVSWWADIISGEIKIDDVVTSRKRLFKLMKKIIIPDSFPDEHVWNAYMSPINDDSIVELKWSVPDLAEIRGFLGQKLSWDHSKTDSSMMPIIRKMSASKQNSIEKYLVPMMNTELSLALKPRMKELIEKLSILHGDRKKASEVDEEIVSAKPLKGRKRSKSNDLQDSDEDDDAEYVQTKSVKKSSRSLRGRRGGFRGRRKTKNIRSLFEEASKRFEGVRR